jgi:hypothetical protein
VAQRPHLLTRGNPGPLILILAPTRRHFHPPAQVFLPFLVIEVIWAEKPGQAAVCGGLVMILGHIAQEVRIRNEQGPR